MTLQVIFEKLRQLKQQQHQQAEIPSLLQEHNASSEGAAFDKYLD